MEDLQSAKQSRLLPDKRPSAQRIRLSFFTMALCFSVNHGTVTALIALASSSFGDLGRYTTGILYVMYTLVALFLSNYIVAKTGHKWGLVAGLAVYCFYVCSFFIGHTIDPARDPAAIVGSVFGGAAAGFLWTAQGGYFTLACKLYAEATQIDLAQASSYFGGVFAAMYLSGEVGIKLLASLLQELPKGGEATVFVIYSIVAVGSAVGMAFVADLQPYDSEENKQKSQKIDNLAKILAAGKLVTGDLRMALLIPTQLTFGFVAVYLNSFANSHIIKDELGSGSDKYIGYMAAITAGVAALLSVPFGEITKRVSKAYIMVLGGVVFLAESLIFLSFTNKQLGTWPWCVLLYSLHGVGRSVFESTNKAVMADFFPDNAPAAFANVIMASGGASSVGFLVSPIISGNTLLIVCVVSACLQIVCSALAFRVNALRKSQLATTPSPE